MSDLRLWPRLFELEAAAPLRGGWLDAERRDRLTVLLEGRPCIDFRDDPVGPGPNPRVEPGVSFEARKVVSGDPAATGTWIEQPAGAPRGLRCGSWLEIALAQPASQVELLLTNLGEITIEVRRAGAAPLVRAVKPGELQGKALLFTGPAILGVQVRGPADGTLLHRICFGVPSAPLPDRILPVALRWRLPPSIGIPRQPFQVWRRPRGDAEAVARDLKLPEVNVAGEQIVEWGRTPFLELRFLAQPGAAPGLTAEALDDEGKPIPGERLTLTTAAPVRLRAPNLCILRLSGNGKASAFSGVPMAGYAAHPGWELIETVGLPFAQAETPAAVYDSARLQGRPAQLRPGLDAARERLAVGGVLFEPPLSPGSPGSPGSAAAPAWPVPSATQVLAEVRGGSASPLELVRQMLAAVDPAQLSGRQEDYVQSIEVDGFRQPPGQPPQQKATLGVPVAGIVLMSAATDGWSALALGFGTTDLPPYQPPPGQHTEPPRPPLPGYDYMVTVGIRLPFGFEVELAALAASRLAPPAPAGTSARTALRNRPQVRDGAASEDVELRWRRAGGEVSPHGCALAIRNGGGALGILNVLNELRATVGFIPHVPASRPDGDLDNETFASFVDTVRPAPLLGTRTDTYLAALLDVFFRWSGWSPASHLIAASGPGQPQILDVRVRLDPDMAVGDEMPAILEVDVAWDWQDRSPQEIQLVGMFHAPAAAPPPSPPAGLQLRPGGPAGTPVGLTFSAAGGEDQTPALPASAGTVARLEIQSQDGDSRRYRVTLSGLTAVFQGTTRLAYAVYARVRERIDPSTPSPYTPPRSAQMRDPRPAPAPVLPAGLQWTALPDATGTARIRLRFPAVARATGYGVYEATEAALRDAAGLGAPSSTALLARAQEIDAQAGLPALQDVFARVAAEPLPAPEVDLGLPGATDGLYAFAVSSLTAEQVESVRSRPVMVAVPRLVTPGAPWLRARVETGAETGAEAGGVAITVGRGAGAPPAGAELYRTQSPLLRGDVDDMGEPVAGQDDPRWTEEDLDGDGLPELRLRDTPPPSWLPYLYRAVAFGTNDPAAGLLPGRSRTSPAAEVLLTPPGPPDLQPVRLALLPPDAAGVRLYRVRVRSGAEVRVSPVGVHRLEILTVNRASVRPEETLHAAAELTAVPPLDPAAAPAAGALARDASAGIDAAGRRFYQSFVPKKDAEVIVRLTDPLGRVSEQRAPLGDPPDLEVVEARFVATGLRVIFRSAAPIVQPPPGAFVVQVLDATTPSAVLLGQASLHEIGPGTRPFFRGDAPGAGGRFAYRFLHPAAPGTVRQVLVRLVEPFGLTSQLRRKVE